MFFRCCRLIFFAKIQLLTATSQAARKAVFWTENSKKTKTRQQGDINKQNEPSLEFTERQTQLEIATKQKLSTC